MHSNERKETSFIYRSIKYLKSVFITILFFALVFSSYISIANASWDISHAWDTGDINVRATSVANVFDRSHSGISNYILAPVQHGVRAYDKDGVIQWTYNGITNGYDIRDIAVGDLMGTGYQDTTVVCSGYYTTTTDGNVAIVDKDGNEIQLIRGSDFPGTIARCMAVAIDGTDIYIGYDGGLIKFVKSGSVWVEASAWNKPIGEVREIEITDAGNGKRVFVAVKANPGIYVYQTNGTLDWSADTGSAGYTGQLEIGNIDSTIPGKEIVIPRQSGTTLFDKDGNLLSVITEGTNVRTGITLYDVDNDGEDEIYFADMGSDIFCYERTGVNTYSKKYSILDSTSDGSGLTNFDIDNDGQDEIFALGIDGYLTIFSADLSTIKKNLNIGHGSVGGFYQNYIHNDHGIFFVDTSGDGHEDIVVSGADGYVDVFESSIVSGSSFTLLYSAGVGGYLQGTTTQYVDSGNSGAAVTALPDSGYRFVGWSDGSTQNPRTDINVTADISVTANFTTTSDGAGVIEFNATGNHSWTVPAGVQAVRVLVVAGGGAGGSANASGGAGGGAGGLIYESLYSVTPGSLIPFTVGAGGIAPTTGTGQNGEDSVFGSLVAIGGGGGGSPITSPGSGGSGGGSYRLLTPGSGTPGQGNPGGMSTSTYDCSGGGGGAETAGVYCDYPGKGFNGGSGKYYGDIFGDNYGSNGWFAGGGGSGPRRGNSDNGSGMHGGGDGGQSSIGQSAQPNTGSGGGGAGGDYSGTRKGGDGGSGLVIIKIVTSSVINLVYTAGENGVLSGVTQQVVEQNQNGSPVTAIADIGYKFAAWSDGSTENPRTDLNVTTDINVTANFEAIDPGANYYLYEATGNHIWTVPDGVQEVEVLVVAGGGAGGGSEWDSAGGGGAGGLIYEPSYAVTPGSSIPVTVGAGGLGMFFAVGENGQNSVFGNLVAIGGGGGGTGETPAGSGGSGGGSYRFLAPGSGTPGQGNPGSNGSSHCAAGGGGAGSPGTYCTVLGVGSNGGGGMYFGDKFGDARGFNGWFAGGGGSGATSGYEPSGSGMHGGGDGSVSVNGESAQANTGSGGGGAGGDSTYPYDHTKGGDGGSGIVIIKTVPAQYSLLYTAGIGGSLTGNTSQYVNQGGSGTSVTAVASAGYQFVNWSDGSTQNPRTDTNVTSDVTVTANFSLNQYTLIYSAGVGGSLSGTAIQYVNHGSSGTAVTAVASAGYSFLNWSDGSTQNPRTDINVTSDKSVTANFEINQYTLEYFAGTGGSLSGSAVQYINHGSNGTAVTAVPSTGYEFASWSDGSTQNPRTDTNVTSDKSVTASFTSSTGVEIVAFDTVGEHTWTVPQDVTSVEVLVVAGGGAGGSHRLRTGTGTGSGGGGAGGLIFENAYTVSPGGTINVTVGAGGIAPSSGGGENGSNSQFGSLTAIGGGGGGNRGDLPGSGGSGGGVGYVSTIGAAGTPGQGNNGGSSAVNMFGGAGGGGAGQEGVYSSSNDGTNGGDGLYYGSIFGDSFGASGWFAGGGGGGSRDGAYNIGLGGSGGGGDGGNNFDATAATPNTGGGGGGSGRTGSWGGDGGSGIVLIKITRSTTHNLQYIAGENGTISGNASQEVSENSDGTAVTAVPSTGYQFVNWSDGSTQNPRTDTNVTSDITVTANFAPNQYTLIYSAGVGGNLSGAAIQYVNHGSSGTAVTAVASAGYSFSNWSDGSTQNPRTDINVISDKSITANFSNNQHTLEYSAGSNGSLSGTALQYVDYGNNGTAVIAVPNTGYQFVSWSDGSTLNPRTDTNVTSDINVTASFLPNQYTLIYSAGVGGSLSGTAVQYVNHGGSGTAVTAIASAGYSFSSWSDGSTQNPRTDINVTGDKLITANFEIDQYILDYSPGPGGTLSGSTVQYVDHGNNGTAVTAVPNTGYQFVSWSDGSTQNPRTDTNVTSDINVTASFSPNQYTLIYSAGVGGSLSGTAIQYVNHGSSGTSVTAIAIAGYSFSSWSDGSTQNPRTDENVTGDKSITANFAIDQYTLEYSVGPGGSLSGTALQYVDHGASGTAVTAVPNTGYQFANWSDGSTQNPRTDTNVTSDINVTANFTPNQYTLIYSAGVGGSLSGTAVQYVNHGGSGTAVTVSESSGYQFLGWSDGSMQNPRTDVNVTSDKSVTALFGTRDFNLLYSATNGGEIIGPKTQSVSLNSEGAPVEARPNSRYYFVGWSDGLTSRERIDTNVNSDRTIIAKFSLIGLYRLEDSENPEEVFVSSGTKNLVADLPLKINATKDTTSAGSEILADKTPYTNDGQNHGAVLNEEGANFVGSNDYISIPMSESLEIQNTLTLSAWIKPVSNTGDIVILGRGAYYLTMGPDWSVRAYWYGKSPAGYHSSGADTVTANEWNMITAVWSSTHIRLYVNGELKNTVACTGTGIQAYDKVWIGAESDGAARRFRGHIANVRIYKDALTDTDVESLYGQGLDGSNFIIRGE